MTDIIQAKKTAPLGYQYTNTGILPNEWTSRPSVSYTHLTLPTNSRV